MDSAKAKEIGSSFFIIACGVFIAWKAKGLSLGEPQAPGPGFFPFWLGVVLVALGGAVLKQGIRPGRKVLSPVSEIQWGRVILVLAAIFAYGLVLEYFGYLVTTFLVMALLLSILVKKAWWFVLSISGLITLLSYLLFKVWLKVLLPRGPFGLWGF